MESSLVGIKIQARNEYFINPTLPSRDEVRKDNYNRRLHQWQCEGLKSKAWRPYLMLGGEPKEFVFQRNATNKIDVTDNVTVHEKNKVKSDVIKPHAKSSSKQRVVISSTPMISSRTVSGKFRITENRETASRCSERSGISNKSMKEEIRKSNLINRNVQSGQSFFRILQNEEEEKKVQEALQGEQLGKVKSVKTAGDDSDDSGSDATYGYEAFECTTAVDFASRPSTSVSMSRKKPPTTRPYTPLYNTLTRLVHTPSLRNSATPFSGSRCVSAYQTTNRSSRPVTRMTHTTIGESESSEMPGIWEQSLFRQLCALHWLLECMVQDSVDSAPNIMLSWERDNNDNASTSQKCQREINQAWDKYISKQVSIPKSSLKTISSRSNQSSILKPSNQKQGGDLIETPSELLYSSDESLPEVKARNKEHDDSSTLKLDQKTEDNVLQAMPRKRTPLSKKRPISSIEHRRKMLDKVKSIEDELLKDDEETKAYKSQLLRLRRQDKISQIKRIASETQLLPEDRCEKRFENFVEESKKKSELIKEEKMLELENQLKNMTEYKSFICSQKFNQFRVAGTYKNMMKQFRGKNTYSNFFSNLEASKNKTIYCDWFRTLQSSMDKSTQHYKISDVMKSIRKYALKTITKYNEKRLFDLLGTLRPWEICHPDIAAAIYFITNQIIPINDETYNDWLQNYLNYKNMIQ